jgi:hypothetical protein
LLAGGAHLLEGKVHLGLRVQKFSEIVGEVDPVFNFNLDNLHTLIIVSMLP